MLIDMLRSNKLAIVTTSWDDGHPLDLPLAELLASKGLRGTFYVAPKSCKRPVMNKFEIRRIQEYDMEIGAHTLTHVVLTELSSDEAYDEVRGSKHALEDITGNPVQSFCYPKGCFNSVVRSQVIEAGYHLARTDISYRFDLKFDPFLMPVGFQFFPHSRIINARHAVRRGNLKGLSYLLRHIYNSNDLMELSRSVMENIQMFGGILHIWGHSWEIEEHDLWGKMEEVLTNVSHYPNVHYLTNSQLLGVL
jgi:hypothetical protein